MKADKGVDQNAGNLRNGNLDREPGNPKTRKPDTEAWAVKARGRTPLCRHPSIAPPRPASERFFIGVHLRSSAVKTPFLADGEVALRA